MNIKHKQLLRLVKRAIRTESLFRFGPAGVCYQDKAMEGFLNAQEELREFVTGERGLLKAGEALGVTGLYGAASEKKPIRTRVKMRE